MTTNYSFDDVLLLPQYSEIESRTQISLKTDLGRGLILDLPIVSSPMDTVSTSPMAHVLDKKGGISIIHRYMTIEEQCKHVDCLGYDTQVGAAVGVSGDFIERANSLVLSGCKILCVDVAHGHHVFVKRALEKLRKDLSQDVHIMAGNVATLEAFNDLADWGADSIRVGIGGGSICSTRIQTGHGQPTLSSVQECSRTDRNATIIADGGIRTSGDIVKALAAGADAVMLGSMLAGTEEAPGETLSLDGKLVKVYRGMASREAQINWRGKYSSDEGVSRFISFRGSVVPILESLEKGMRSGLSYSGAFSIPEFQTKAKFIKQSPSSQIESSTHVDRIV